jgi:pilus assembly protein Flp/PilA
MNLLARFMQNESATTAIEYGLIASLIAGAIIATVQLLGVNVSAMYTAIANAFN